MKHEHCCPGGLTWIGLAEPHPKLKYFVTVGTPDFRGGAAEHLKATPELFDEQKERAGKITPHSKYTVIAPCTDETAPETVRAFILFAGSEHIRNLCGHGRKSTKRLGFCRACRPNWESLASTRVNDYGHPCRVRAADGIRPGRFLYLQTEQDRVS
ncbi:DUF169 domain-containing protein [Methanosarcina siciliae]|uniref:DUF169 domain-containing protein n=1 Tax=Methanosarcina siciliae TaxID=38027 RepID=UPI001E4CEF6F|nr:DUF169 domain-containing protein [Methanosarcina siciliae]